MTKRIELAIDAVWLFLSPSIALFIGTAGTLRVRSGNWLGLLELALALAVPWLWWRNLCLFARERAAGAP